MTLCAMVPLLAFTCLNSVLHQRIPQKFRIMGSLAVILVVFLLTAILVKIEMAPLPFFTLTMIKIVIINCEFFDLSTVPFLPPSSLFLTCQSFPFNHLSCPESRT
ncbi:unnamed protein product, partial [Oncorhynchus mykiss]